MSWGMDLNEGLIICFKYDDDDDDDDDWKAEK